MNPAGAQSDRVDVVEATGRLTVSQAGRLRERLLEAFERADRVELALRDVLEADLSFVQLVCAAQQTSASRGVALRVSGLDAAAPLLRLISAAGIERKRDCPEGCLCLGHDPADAAGPAKG